MENNLAPDPVSAQRIDSAGLRFAYARAFGIAVPDAPSRVDQSLLALLRDRGLTEDDAMRVIASDQAIAVLPKKDKRPWTAVSYNDLVRPAIVEEFGANAETKLTWPPRHDGFSQTWSDAVESAGLIPARISVRQPTKEEALPHLRSYLESSGGSRSARDYVAWRKKGHVNAHGTTAPSLDMLNRVFGSWTQALDAAGQTTTATSQTARQAENAAAELVADLERHEAATKRLREELRAPGGASPDVVAHHTELAFIVAMETHALASSRVFDFLLTEREARDKTFKHWAIAGTTAVAFVPPILEFLLSKFL